MNNTFFRPRVSGRLSTKMMPFDHREEIQMLQRLRSWLFSYSATRTGIEFDKMQTLLNKFAGGHQFTSKDLDDLLVVLRAAHGPLEHDIDHCNEWLHNDAEGRMEDPPFIGMLISGDLEEYVKRRLARLEDWQQALNEAIPVFEAMLKPMAIMEFGVEMVAKNHNKEGEE